LAEINLPEHLLAKYGPEIRAGLLAVQHKRAEFEFNHPSERRPVYQFPPPSNLQVISEPKPSPAAWPSDIKAWPLVILAGMRSNHGGSARLYFLIRALDKPGRGLVKRADLFAYLAELAVDTRQRRRWLRDALDLGLLAEKGLHGEPVYFYPSLGRAALLLGCDRVGKPAELRAAELARSGWRAVVWAGFLATLNNKPMSQEQKAALTGIAPRVQRLYQAAIPGQVQKNFAYTTFTPEQVAGVKELQGRAVFVSHSGRVLQRLPDTRIVPLSVSRSLARGRSKKAQAMINQSLSQGRQGQEIIIRLFCESPKQTKASQARLKGDAIPPWEVQEVFEHLTTGPRAAMWQAIPTGGKAL